MPSSRIASWVPSPLALLLMKLITRRQRPAANPCPIAISSISPYFGPKLGGTDIIVHATNIPLGVALYCQFGVNFVSASRITNETIVCVTPAHWDAHQTHIFSDSVLLHIVSISRGDVSFTAPNMPSTMFDYVSEVNLTSIEPSTGPENGGVIISVYGEGFIDTHDLACVFAAPDDSLLYSAATFTSSGLVECQSPRIQDGSSMPKNRSYTVHITNNGQDISASHLTFEFIPLIRIDSVVPSSGPVDGGNIVENFRENFRYGATTATFGGNVDVECDYVSSNHVMCRAPAWNYRDTVEVGMKYAAESTAENATLSYRYISSPIVYSVEPSFGPEKGGTKVSVLGANFVSENDIFCIFDKVEVLGDVISGNELLCVSPSRIPGTSAFRIKSSGGAYGTVMPSDGFAFTYVMMSHVDSVSPIVGPIHGGTRVTISGQGFRNSSKLVCIFGSRRASAEYKSTTEIVCKTPHVASAGPVPIYISINGVDEEPAFSSFNYAAIPVISEVSPDRGPIQGATSVVIRGSGFVNAPHLSCLFDGVSTASHFISRILLNVRVPRVKCGTTYSPYFGI